MTRFRRRGSATIEMTLVGIPIIFTLISIFEISRGMWMYQTLAYSVKVGMRYAIVHGASCDPTINNGINDCIVGVKDVASTIENAAVGLLPQDTLLTFVPGITSAATCPTVPALSSCTPCYMGSSSGSVTGTFGTYPGCLSLTIPAPPHATSPANQWPPEGSSQNENSVGQPVEIDIRTPFRSAIAMFWPDQKTVNFAATAPQCLDATHKFGVTCFGSTSTDDIQF